PDGTVLIAGSQSWGGWGDPTAEIYIPSGKFVAAGNMITARHSHTATLLPDGTVLIAGGHSSWPFPTSATEIYHPVVSVPAAVLLSLSGDGQGQGVILHSETHQV